MLNKIVNALKAREDISAWTVRHITTDGAQIYAVPKGIESQRNVGSVSYKIDVLCDTTGPDGSPAVGSGDITLLPGEDISAAIDKAALVASLVANPPHGIPEPAPLPDVQLVDDEVWNDPASAMEKLMEDILSTSRDSQGVRMTAAECFGDKHTIRLVNSRGVDAEQKATTVAAEFVLQAKKGEIETESFIEKTRRRVTDFEVEAEYDRQSGYTLDSLEAQSAPNWQGAVVILGDTLTGLMVGDSLVPGVIQIQGSAASKYAKMSSWEIGESVFKTELKGDPLTIWANRRIPYGTLSNCFDDEGVPAGRVELIKDNRLVTFTASQRYAEYLDIPVTGAFGGVELPPGRTAAADLLQEPYIEIAQFSWFNPDPVTGDFATEIRLGYLVENGVRKPFKGGQLIGNLFEALADVHWSLETGFFGSYLGPHTARFNNLKVSGEET